MSTVQEIESAIQRLSPEEIRRLHSWLEEQFEDHLQFTDDFKASIERGKQQIADGEVRVHKP